MSYTFRLNGKKFESNESKLTGNQLLTIAHLTPTYDYELLYRINEKGFTPIQLDEEVDLKTAGIEGFKAKPYKGITIKVDDREYEVSECFMTPKEIMTIAGINSDFHFLRELRSGGVEVTYKDDIEHKVAITKTSYFLSSRIEARISCVIVNAREKPWTQETISFEEVVILEYGCISSNSNIIYTVNYVKGVPSKPEGSMVKGDMIFVKNKMVFNVTQTNKS